jgi:hypothetical protein
MAAPVLQLKRGLLANLPGLRVGEPGFTTDSYDLYVGIDSTTANNKFFGSHRYWTRGTATTGSGVNLVEGTNNGTDYITLKSPDTLSGIVTYTLPATNGSPASVLTNNGNGILSWSSGSNNATFTGITTFTDGTDNTLGDANTGSVQIDGGVGINKNLTVGANLNVQGYSEFVGVVTFKGGTINLGDATGDNITVGGRFASNLTPNLDNTYDVGISTLNWRNAHFSGIGTFETGIVADGVRLGVGGNGVVDTASGPLYLDSGSGTTIVNDTLNVAGNLNIGGNVTIGGTTVVLTGQDVFIQNKDIVLGYSTNTSNVDNSTDTSANHGGVAVASTEGTPLANFNASGINTLPSTYKQMMWFKSGTLGFSTDAFAFNYGVAIGTTTMANGVRLAVGSGVTFGDTSVTAATGNFTNLNGSLVGTISTATRATVVDTTGTSTNADYYATFVDTLAGQTGETLRVGVGLSVNPSDGSVKTTGVLSVGNPSNTTSYIKAGGGSNAMYLFGNGDVSFQAKVIANNIRSSSNSSDTLTLSDLDASFARNLYIAGITTVNNNFNVAGVTTTQHLRVTGVTTTNGINATGISTLASLNVSGVTTSQHLQVTGVSTFLGTVNHNAATFATNQTTYNLVNATTTNVNFAGAATALVMSAATGVTTVRNKLLVAGNLEVDGNNIQASDGNNNITLTSNTLTTFAGDVRVNGNDIQASDGNTNISLTSNTLTTFAGDIRVNGNDIQSSSGANVITLATNNATFANDVTVSGNLYVNGSTTQVNTTTTTIEDQLLDLGMVDGAVPTSDLNKDIGLLLNYYTTSAKKAAVFWDDSASRIVFADDVTESSGVLTVAANAYASIEIEGLWVNDCAGQSQVISCTGSTRNLENITIDGGAF